MVLQHHHGNSITTRWSFFNICNSEWCPVYPPCWGSSGCTVLRRRHWRYRLPLQKSEGHWPQLNQHVILFLCYGGELSIELCSRAGAEREKRHRLIASHLIDSSQRSQQSLLPMTQSAMFVFPPRIKPDILPPYFQWVSMSDYKSAIHFFRGKSVEIRLFCSMDWITRFLSCLRQGECCEYN